MNKDEDITRVVFRKWKNGDIIALFPDICNDVNNNPDICLSYEHIGQHGSADYGIVAITKLATKDEYMPLFVELESLGYNLKVCKRR